MKAILINTAAKTKDLFVTEVEVDEDDILHSFYSLTDCTQVECVMRNIGGRIFDVICDENGRYHKRLPSAIGTQYRETFVGNLVLCHSSDDGYWTEIEEDDLDIVKSNVAELVYGPKIINVVKLTC